MAWQDIPKPARFRNLPVDPRGFPVISTVGRNETGAAFGSLSEGRKLALATFDWCAVCGYPFRDEARWQVVPVAGGQHETRSGVVYGEAPVHEICFLYAAQVCPNLASPGARLGDDMRGGQRRNPVVDAIAYRTTRRIDIRASDLQRGMHVVHFAQTGPVERLSYARPEELVDRYADRLAAESIPHTSAPESELIKLFCEMSGAGARVVGAAVVVGAAFARNVFQLAGFAAFDNPTYRELTLAAIGPDGLAGHAPIEDRAIRLAGEWLREEQEMLPALVSAWRRDGRNLAGAHATDRPAGPGRTVSKTAPCPCGSGRRAGRCHPGGIAAIGG